MNIDIVLLEVHTKWVSSQKHIFQNPVFYVPFLADWTGIVPTYDIIPASLLQVLKDPFPIPSPAPLPPLDIAYAWPIPQEIQEILATVHLITSMSEDKGKGKLTEVSPPSPPTPTPAPPLDVGLSRSFNQASNSTASRHSLHHTSHPVTTEHTWRHQMPD